MDNGCVRLLGIVFCSVVLAAPSGAQVAQAELRGTIFDTSGAALPGVTVTATETQTGTSRTSVTSPTGTYVMPALPVGTYTVKAELSGFTTLTKEGIRLAVGESASLDFKLTVAAIAETVTVTGESPLVDTKKSDLSGRIDQKQVEGLPLNGRTWTDLVALVPGARGRPGDIQAGSSGSDMAKYNVDGVDVTNQCCGGSNQNYSQENIAEFQVLTNRYDAEYGRVNGAIINAITKAGSNDLRGTAFGYFRNSKFGDAPNFYTGVVAPFDQKQTGLNAGGPIVKNKAFFFGSFEYNDLVATAHPNTGIAAFDVDAPAGTTKYMTTGRADIQINDKHRLFGRFSNYSSNQLNVSVSGNTAISGGYSYPVKNNDFSLGETWVVSEWMVNEVRLGASAINNKLDSNCYCVQLVFPSATLGSPANSPQWWKEMNIQANDLMSYYVPNFKGEHSMKFGFQFFRPHFWGAFPDPAFGSFMFAKDPTDFNDPSTYPAPTRYTIPLGDTSYTIMNPTYGMFYQDNWTLSKKITVNLGIRYDLETGTTNADLQSPIQPGHRPLDKNNIAPRIGFAYDIRGDGRSVVRGGVGRYFDKVMLNLTSNERRLILGQLINVNITSPSFTNPLGGKTYQDYLNQHIPGSLTLLDNNYETPQNDQESIGLSQQLGSRYAMNVDYVHSRGWNEPMTPSVNFFENPVTHLPEDPTIYGRPYPQYTNITLTSSTGRSQYDGLQVGFTGRANRVQFQGSYTLSRTLDNHNGNRGGTPTNWFNLADEFTYSSSDQRHRFVGNMLTTLPYGLQFSAIYFVGSPRTINVTTNLDPFHLGYSGRWLDAAGDTIPRNSARTTTDQKVDFRISKTLKVQRYAIQGVLDIFNVFDTQNNGTYGMTYGSRTYLQPSTSTNLFYQPRQIQLGIRFIY
jgi:hypothetical protein